MLSEPRMGQKCQQRPLLGTWICSAMCQNSETCDNKTKGQILTVLLVLTILALVLTVLALVLPVLILALAVLVQVLTVLALILETLALALALMWY